MKSLSLFQDEMKAMFLPYFAIGVSHVNKCPVIFSLTFLHSSCRSKVIIFIRMESTRVGLSIDFSCIFTEEIHSPYLPLGENEKIIFVRHVI